MRRLNIVIPIAGPDKDPANTGYVRSLQEIQRKTILQYAFESLQSICASNFVVVIKQKDVNHYHLDNVVKLLRPEAKIIIAEGETMGAACTCMLAVDQLDMDAPLLITGVDQILTVSTFQIVED